MLVPAEGAAEDHTRSIYETLPLERRKWLVKEFKIEAKVNEHGLKDEGWNGAVVAAASKEVMQKLAEKNSVAKTGSKTELLERVVKYMLGK